MQYFNNPGIIVPGGSPPVVGRINFGPPSSSFERAVEKRRKEAKSNDGLLSAVVVGVVVTQMLGDL